MNGVGVRIKGILAGLLMLALWVSCAGAVEEQRVALVIGNATYANSPLKNPVNDAEDIAAKLSSLGFNVVKRPNLTTRQIGSTLREFRAKLQPGAVAIVFYAGHGLQIKGENYLPTVDAEINSEEDVPNQSLAVRQIMDVLEDARTRVNLVFLDACRNNPYARSFRSTGDGLARMNAPSGTLISFATRPGSVAADGTGRNGLYTEQLLKQMDEPNVAIEQVLKRVLSGVKGASAGKQEPWMEGSLEGDFYFRKGTGTQVANLVPVPVPVTSVARSAADVEEDTWKAAQSSGDVAAYMAYLDSYPNGRYAKLALAEKQKAQGGIVWIRPSTAVVSTKFNDNGSKGWDFSGYDGDPVLAAADGTVKYSGDGLSGFGKLVIIKHDANFMSAYAHNRKLLVREEQKVARGQKIAEMGKTDTDIVKLHFQIRSEGKPVDPALYLPLR